MQALEQLGWKEGRNIRIDIRWGEDKVDLERKYAAELVALEPEVILASGTMSVSALQLSAVRYRLCSRQSPIRSVPVSSSPWRGRAATRLAS